MEYGPRKRVEKLKKGDLDSRGRKIMEIEVHNKGPLKGHRVIHYDGQLKGDIVSENQIIELSKSEKERLTHKRKYF